MEDHIYKAPESNQPKSTGIAIKLKIWLFRFRWFQKLEVYLATKSKNYKISVYLTLALVAILLITIFIRFAFSSELRRLWGGGRPLPAKPVEFELNLSAYADDPEVLDIEIRLGILNKEIENIDLKQIDLKPPSLDFEIDFDKN